MAYIDPNYQQPRPEHRSRQASSASMNKYVPESYGGPPVQPPPPQGYFDGARPRGPSVGTQTGYIPPDPNAYAPPAGAYTPNAPVYTPNQLHPSYTPNGQPQPAYSPNVDRDGYMQPPPHARRPSHSSMHSQRSQRSHHSHHSRNSHDSRRSKHSHHSSGHDRRSSDGGDRRRSRDKSRDRSRDSRRSRDGRDVEPLKRTSTHRPSWGDSIYGLFNIIKDALGPRDKY